MFENIKNIPEYHSIIASIQLSIANLLASKNKEAARHIIEFEILQAFCSEAIEKTPNITLDKLIHEITELHILKNKEKIKIFSDITTFDIQLITMFFYQYKAGFRPTQKNKTIPEKYNNARSILEQD